MSQDKFANIPLEDMTIEDIYELEEIHSPLVSSKDLKRESEDLDLKKDRVRSISPMTSEEIKSMME